MSWKKSFPSGTCRSILFILLRVGLILAVFPLAWYIMPKIAWKSVVSRSWSILLVGQWSPHAASEFSYFHVFHFGKRVLSIRRKTGFTEFVNSGWRTVAFHFIDSAQSGAKIPDHDVFEFGYWIFAFFVDGQCDRIMTRTWDLLFFLVGNLNSGCEGVC